MRRNWDAGRPFGLAIHKQCAGPAAGADHELAAPVVVAAGMEWNIIIMASLERIMPSLRRILASLERIMALLRPHMTGARNVVRGLPLFNIVARGFLQLWRHPFWRGRAQSGKAPLQMCGETLHCHYPVITQLNKMYGPNLITQ